MDLCRLFVNVRQAHISKEETGETGSYFCLVLRFTYDQIFFGMVWNHFFLSAMGEIVEPLYRKNHCHSHRKW